MLQIGPKREQQLKKAIKNFNAKVNRQSKGKYANIQPEKLNYKEEKAILERGTLKDFNQYISDIKKYSVRGAEKPSSFETRTGAELSKWAMHRVEESVTRINKQRAEQLKELQEEEHLNPGSVSQTRIDELRPLTNKRIKQVSQRGQGKVVKKLMHQKINESKPGRDRIYAVNFRNTAVAVFGDTKLAKYLCNLSDAEIIRLVDKDDGTYTKKEYLNIEFMYSEEDKMKKKVQIFNALYDENLIPHNKETDRMRKSYEAVREKYQEETDRRMEEQGGSPEPPSEPNV